MTPYAPYTTHVSIGSRQVEIHIRRLTNHAMGHLPMGQGRQRAIVRCRGSFRKGGGWVTATGPKSTGRWRRRHTPRTEGGERAEHAGIPRSTRIGSRRATKGARAGDFPSRSGITNILGWQGAGMKAWQTLTAIPGWRVWNYQWAF